MLSQNQGDVDDIERSCSDEMPTEADVTQEYYYSGRACEAPPLPSRNVEIPQISHPEALHGTESSEQDKIKNPERIYINNIIVRPEEVDVSQEYYYSGRACEAPPLPSRNDEIKKVRKKKKKKKRKKRNVEIPKICRPEDQYGMASSEHNKIENPQNIYIASTIVKLEEVDPPQEYYYSGRACKAPPLSPRKDRRIPYPGEATLKN